MDHYMASPARRMLVQMQLNAQPRHALSSPRDSERSDSEIEDTVLLPFIRPVVMQPVTSSESGSPKGDDWTIVETSPTFESLVHGRPSVTESWFSRP
ncbi:hypothetical protein PINS_up005888 [Pythium insidiosum]|nr:hypothetical protein PINS_up005888 [Pythium insidiosum]